MTLAGPAGPFTPPEQLADAHTATLPQPVGAAISARAAVVAWAGPGGVRLARVSGERWPSDAASVPPPARALMVPRG